MPLRAIVFNDTSYDDHHGCQLVMLQLFKLAQAANIHIERSCPMRHEWRADEQLKRDISNADLCIVNGEGTMHDSCSAAHKYALLASYCRQQGVPCFLINSVWQNNAALLDYARDFRAVFVRDIHSQKELLAGGVKASVVPDLTLTYKPQASVSPRQGYLVNGSVLEARLAEAWQSLSKVEEGEYVRYLSIRTLPPLQFGKGFPRYIAGNISRRIKLLRHIAYSYFSKCAGELDSRALSRLRWRHSIVSTPAFIRALSGAAGVITGRFHCVTLCMVTRTPFFALSSNTHKIEGLLAEAGLSKRLCSSYEEGLKRRHSMAFSADESQALEAFLRSAGVRAEAMFREIFELASADRVKNVEKAN